MLMPAQPYIKKPQESTGIAERSKKKNLRNKAGFKKKCPKKAMTINQVI